MPQATSSRADTRDEGRQLLRHLSALAEHQLAPGPQGDWASREVLGVVVSQLAAASSELDQAESARAELAQAHASEVMELKTELAVKRNTLASQEEVCNGLLKMADDVFGSGLQCPLCTKTCKSLRSMHQHMRSKNHF